MFDFIFMDDLMGLNKNKDVFEGGEVPLLRNVFVPCIQVSDLFEALNRYHEERSALLVSF